MFITIHLPPVCPVNGSCLYLLEVFCYQPHNSQWLRFVSSTNPEIVPGMFKFKLLIHIKKSWDRSYGQDLLFPTVFPSATKNRLRWMRWLLHLRAGSLFKIWNRWPLMPAVIILHQCHFTVLKLWFTTRKQSHGPWLCTVYHMYIVNLDCALSIRCI